MERNHKISLNVNDELWHKFRLKCLKEKKTATELIEEFMNDYLKK